MKIPFYSLDVAHQRIRSELSDAFGTVLEGNSYILGEKLQQFEREYAEFNGVQNCIGVSNGLDALFLCLKALDIGPGDEVIVPSNTFIATLLAVSHTGAKPVLAEPDSDTYTINSDKFEEVISPRTKAVIPVHLFGQCCDMTIILGIAKKYKLFVIEDNAQSQGATHRGQLAGSFGNLNATSFYPGKVLGALGDAGAVTTNDTVLMKKVRLLRNYGSDKKYEHELIGYNKRLDELQAAFLRVKLSHLPGWIAERRQIAALYDASLKNTGDIVLPVTSVENTHVYHQYVIRTKKRDPLQQYLNREGIGTQVHYPVPAHLQKGYAGLGYKKGDLPVAEKLAETSLSLPVWPGMTPENVHHVCAAIGKFYGN